MKVWCVTDRSTEQLRASGMVGVSVVVGTTTLKPGSSMNVPSHLVAELQPAFRQGLLSTKEPAPAAEPLFTRPIVGFSKIEPTKTEPIKATVVSVEAPTEPPAEPETPEPDNTEHRRRRR